MQSPHAPGRLDRAFAHPSFPMFVARNGRDHTYLLLDKSSLPKLAFAPGAAERYAQGLVRVTQRWPPG